MSQGRLYRSYLYVPASDEHKVEKALESGADCVVLDLEDAVAPSEKDHARQVAADVLMGGNRSRPIFVRLNAPGSTLLEQDLELIAPLSPAGVRLPKVESPEMVREVGCEFECRGAHNTKIQCLIESALGLERVFEIARAHPLVAGMGLGEVDLAADLGVSDERGLIYARSRVVCASRAAGLPGPVGSVYTNVRDEEGLRNSTLVLKALGFVGRSAIHPRQVKVINDVFTPDAEEIRKAKEVIKRIERAEALGSGAFALPDGSFVDRAVVEAARSKLELARLSEGGEL
ncbi:HpcH/HpaI aldolase/citrate lyase family protein [Rubrobacter calidifluminis]|uniref:HpcH/HpaI aldolase/citrate lyase family protein n=1 Tax=Rubrobacter calidifluminis TaxID=1392640 RepID=UPI00236067DD|nr:CoA ester lyase [Rubrobacter calidifluminis]